MFIKSLLAALIGSRTPQLAALDTHAPRIEVAILAVHTAEQMLILNIDTGAVNIIREIARSGNPATLFNDSTSVHLRPTNNTVVGAELPVKDPKRGWIIPMPRPIREGIEARLTGVPGDIEIAPQLAFIVETPPLTITKPAIIK